jgi:hypothetical protein
MTKGQQCRKSESVPGLCGAGETDRMVGQSGGWLSGFGDRRLSSTQGGANESAGLWLSTQTPVER